MKFINKILLQTRIQANYMYFFNRTCLCLSGYKPYIIKKTKFESDCQIIGSAQNE